MKQKKISVYEEGECYLPRNHNFTLCIEKDFTVIALPANTE